MRYQWYGVPRVEAGNPRLSWVVGLGWVERINHTDRFENPLRHEAVDGHAGDFFNNRGGAVACCIGVPELLARFELRSFFTDRLGLSLEIGILIDLCRDDGERQAAAMRQQVLNCNCPRLVVVECGKVFDDRIVEMDFAFVDQNLNCSSSKRFRHRADVEDGVAVHRPLVLSVAVAVYFMKHRLAIFDNEQLTADDYACLRISGDLVGDRLYPGCGKTNTLRCRSREDAFILSRRRAYGIKKQREQKPFEILHFRLFPYFPEVRTVKIRFWAASCIFPLFA